MGFSHNWLSTFGVADSSRWSVVLQDSSVVWLIYHSISRYLVTQAYRSAYDALVQLIIFVPLSSTGDKEGQVHADVPYSCDLCNAG